MDTVKMYCGINKICVIVPGQFTPIPLGTAAFDR